MLAKQVDIEDLVPVSHDGDPVIQKTYTFPRSQERVHDAAHEMVNQTMSAGKATNGLNTWMNQDPLTYHVAKGLIHVSRVHHFRKLDCRESEEPHLLDLFNAVTRFCMAWALQTMKPQQVGYIAPHNPED